jgi:hypothetical protein
MQLPSPHGGWKHFLWRCIPLVVVLLWPWPGLATLFSGAVADGCDAVAGQVSGTDSEIHFVADRYEPAHPWWVRMSVKNVFTGESFEVPLDTRTVAYIRIVVFLSLAIAWPFWSTRRGTKATLWGFALLIGSIALTVVFPLLQVLSMVKVLGLGVLTQSVLSIGILTFVTYPSMAFAIPGLVWLLTLRMASDDAGRSARTPLPGVPVSGTR